MCPNGGWCRVSGENITASGNGGAEVDLPGITELVVLDLGDLFDDRYTKGMIGGGGWTPAMPSGRGMPRNSKEGPAGCAAGA